MRSLPYQLLVLFSLLHYFPAHTQTARPVDGYATDIGGEHEDHLYCIGTSKRLFKWNSRTQKWAVHSEAKRNLKRVTTWKYLPVVIDERGLVFLYRNGKFNEGTVIHEFLHAAGFYHEQQRNDRDNFIQINFDNITLFNRHNFWKEDRDNAHTCGTYDVSSIMHYSGYAFSRNDEPTIIDRRTGLPVERTDELSETDKECINLIYKVEGREMVPPDVSRVREMKLTVKSLWTNTLENRVGDNQYPDFFADIEIGSGWRWTPGLDDTSTKQVTTEVIQNAHEVRPNWMVNHFLDAGVAEAKVAITLKDEDGVRDRARYDIFDVNPRPGETTLELLINTATGEIFLGAPGGRTDLLIGYMGETLYVSGYDGDFYAQMGFEIGW